MATIVPLPGATPGAPRASWAPEAPQAAATVLPVPVALLRFHQPMAEHGPGACAQPIGAAFPPDHRQFRSSSD